ncbi:ribokinase [Siculibacillus lacustris]|uniref:Ribokinase n=1 Tax=Siculibacillus lacustris TaxID=1549641 RepID=A0A4Q9VUB5_9HYPH|nr:ribokinase [Siculibacillus lacustris]TBW39762.1 ribokinase [Siculibacillus lacustris]
MITVFGSINVDLVSRVARLPRVGETLPGSDVVAVAGGKGANQALAARRAGAAGRMIGAVGDDSFAAVALSGLDAAGVDLSGVARRARFATGLAIISVTDSGENAIVLSPGANRTVDRDLAAAARFAPGDLLLLQMEVSEAESLAVAARARLAGARVMLSLAPFRPLPAEAFTDVDVVVVNAGEAADLAGHLGVVAPGATVGPSTIAAAIADRLGLTVVVTLGGEGVVAATPDGTVHRVPALAVTPIDTTGAGDTFTGVLAAGLSAGLDLAAAMARAAAAGSLACLELGAQAAMPSAAAIDRALADGVAVP